MRDKLRPDEMTPARKRGLARARHDVSERRIDYNTWRKTVRAVGDLAANGLATVESIRDACDSLKYTMIRLQDAMQHVDRIERGIYSEGDAWNRQESGPDCDQHS